MSISNKESVGGICPVCYNIFKIDEIEMHVSKCIFLNTQDSSELEQLKRKRTKSPTNYVASTSTSPTNYSSPKKKGKGNTITLSKYFQVKSRSMQEESEDDKTNKQPLDKLLECLNESLEDQPIDEGLQDVDGLQKEIKQKKLLNNVPLASQVQPKNLNEFFGQNHVLGKDAFLRRLLENDEIPNMILWGPPGCGKTSLSGIIKEICKSNSKQLKFVSLCASTSGVKDVQNIIAAAKGELKFNRKTILFMDEIHRFNKRQQDVFLLHVEKGDIILIGATTENPSFTLNSALLSRCRVIVMEKLNSNDLVRILKNAAKQFGIQIIDVKENPYFMLKPNSSAIDEEAIIWIADVSDGDARIALGNLEMIMHQEMLSNTVITLDIIKDKIKKSHMLYDRKGEEHYNIISAMHKSIRGSDPNAALYWTTRMIVSGEDPLYIARRMVRAASEDIGNADPNALQLAISTMQGCQLLGMPEADVLLAQCAIYLARAPKSREADSALAKAKQLINYNKGIQPAVPMHIRNAPTKLLKDLGYGQVADGTAPTFMPPELKNVNFF